MQRSAEFEPGTVARRGIVLSTQKEQPRVRSTDKGILSYINRSSRGRIPHVTVCVSVCVRACVRACVGACVHVRACVPVPACACALMQIGCVAATKLQCQEGLLIIRYLTGVGRRVTFKI
jgi:hypothetical protein